MTYALRQNAFTLVELILAVSMAIALTLAMLWFYDHTAATRDNVMDEKRRVGTRRAVMDRVTNELRSALSVSFLRIGLTGQSDSMTFTTVALPGEAAWAVRTSTEDPIPPEQDLVLLTYRLRIEEDENGDDQIVGLEKGIQKIITARAAEEAVADATGTEPLESEDDEEAEIQTTLVSSDFKFLRLRYFDGREWVPEYQGTTLPLAVDVAFGYEPLPDGTDPDDYPHELIHRVIYLPGSTATQEDGGIRGLTEGGL